MANNSIDLTTEDGARKWYLSMDREIKLNLLEDALKEKEYGHFFKLQKWLLDAPISQGGIETDAIKEIANKYLQTP